MDFEGRLPLDISEFKCTSVGKSAVVVVFEQTNRRYTYSWRGGELAIAYPAIEGRADPHPPEIIDCLARAVAYKAARDACGGAKATGGFWQGFPPFRGPAARIRDFLHIR